MKPLVVDASVVVKLYFAEEFSEDVERRFSSAKELIAPDFLLVETANVIWKRYRHGDISKEQASGIAEQIKTLPLDYYASGNLATEALNLAIKTGCTVYDCMYIALAVQQDAVMVSGDRRLVNSLADTPLEKYVNWIGDSR